MAQVLRKVFLERDLAGSTTEYWEAQWLGELRAYEGVTKRLLETHIPAGSHLLEAGCGQGEIAAALAGRGHRVVGLDLARSALGDCRRRHQDLPLVVGDVGRFPFADATFDAIVSLGVVEHFEAGPVDLLREHARVLSDEGVLFLTVPARGWYRRWSDTRHLRLGRASLYRQRRRMVGLRREPAIEVSPAGAFHQYEFPRSMIERFCMQAGLRVERWQPHGVSWALGDSALVGRLVAGGAASAGPDASAARPVDGPEARSDLETGRSVRAYVRRPVIEEVGHDPLQRAMAWSATRAFGHMQLLVAKVDPRSR